MYRTSEPALEVMVFFVIRKLILQTRKGNHPMGLDVWFLVGPFVYFHTSCVRTAKALARLRGCAGSSEPSMVAYVISTIISWTGSLVPTKVQEWSLCKHCLKKRTIWTIHHVAVLSHLICILWQEENTKSVALFHHFSCPCVPVTFGVLPLVLYHWQFYHWSSLVPLEVS